jgi:hypothetical protein
MKTYINIKTIVAGIGFLGLLAGLSACAEFLEEKPKSSVTSNQYYTKPEHARATVNALYGSGFLDLYSGNGASNAYGGPYSGPNIMLGGYLSGLFDSEYSGMYPYVKRCQELNITPQNEIATWMDYVWDMHYSAILRANNAIKYIPETPELSGDETTYLLAQAKFFRALNYFHLVKFFGDVPLITEPYESFENLYAERTPSAQVYALIEQDLKDAVAAGGLKDAIFTNEFRVTKHTANALLANVYLQWSGYPLQGNHYADAAAAARTVITGGKHSLAQHGGTPETSAYNTLRTEDRNPEIVYAKEFNASIADGGWWPSYSATGEVVGSLFTSWSILTNVYAVTKVLYNAYDPTDMRVAEKQFFYTSYGTYTYLCDGYPDPTKRVCNWFYFEEEAMLSGARPGKDKPIIRYAEVLLTAAEATAQANGVTQDAVNYLKEVRQRAGLDVSSLTTAMSKDNFIEEVWTERLREFPLEFKVWDDIQRTRKYPQTTAASPGVVTWVNVIGATNPWGATFQEKHLLWPISDNERQRNPSLTQNPGY